MKAFNNVEEVVKYQQERWTQEVAAITAEAEVGKTDKKASMWVWYAITCVLVAVALTFGLDPKGYVWKTAEAPTETWTYVFQNNTVEELTHEEAMAAAKDLLSVHLKGRMANESDTRQFLTWAREVKGGKISLATANEYVTTWVQPNLERRELPVALPDHVYTGDELVVIMKAARLERVHIQEVNGGTSKVTSAGYIIETPMVNDRGEIKPAQAGAVGELSDNGHCQWNSTNTLCWWQGG